MATAIENLKIAQDVLSRLGTPVTYVGGAVVALYIDDPAASPLRLTIDVDCVVQATTYAQYTELETELRELGLQPASYSGAPVCRWIYGGLEIDIMPLKGDILGFRNQWYAEGVQYAVKMELAPNTVIQVFSSPYVLADKINTFIDRGEEDYYGSPDFEDIIRLLDGCTHLIDDLHNAQDNVRTYIHRWIKDLLKKSAVEDYVAAHLEQRDRSEVILRRMRGL